MAVPSGQLVLGSGTFCNVTLSANTSICDDGVPAPSSVASNFFSTGAFITMGYSNDPSPWICCATGVDPGQIQPSSVDCPDVYQYGSYVSQGFKNGPELNDQFFISPSFGEKSLLDAPGQTYQLFNILYSSGYSIWETNNIVVSNENDTYSKIPYHNYITGLGGRDKNNTIDSTIDVFNGDVNQWFYLDHNSSPPEPIMEQIGPPIAGNSQHFRGFGKFTAKWVWIFEDVGMTRWGSQHIYKSTVLYSMINTEFPSGTSVPTNCNLFFSCETNLPYLRCFNSSFLNIFHDSPTVFRI